MWRFSEPPTPPTCRTCDTPLERNMGGTFCPYCDGLHRIHDHNGFEVYAGDLMDCRRELQNIIHNRPMAYFHLLDPLGEVVDQGGNREML